MYVLVVFGSLFCFQKENRVYKNKSRQFYISNDLGFGFGWLVLFFFFPFLLCNPFSTPNHQTLQCLFLQPAVRSYSQAPLCKAEILLFCSKLYFCSILSFNLYLTICTLCGGGSFTTLISLLVKVLTSRSFLPAGQFS